VLINRGTQERLLRETTLGAGSTIKEGSVNTDSILVTVFVESVTSGTLVVTVDTLTDNGKQLQIIGFPTVSSPSTELLLKKSAVSMQRFEVTATYTGICQYEVYVRAIEGAGESSVRILGPANLSTSSATVTTSAAALIPAALTDRSAVSIRNYSGAGTIFVSESLAKLSSDAWPIGPGETWSLDIASGVTLYAVSSSGSNGIRIAEAGG
jgi:hypothetical protein